MTDHGLFDIHCHLIPGVDDGAQDLEETRRLLCMEYEQGVRHIIATPHFRNQMFETPIQTIRKQFALVQQCVQELNKEYDTNLHVYLGCEFHANMQMSKMLDEGSVSTMANSGYVLVEFSGNAEYSYIEERLRSLIIVGYRPIIAHAERCDNLWGDLELIRDLAQMGAYIQVNADSILGKSGFYTKRFCRKLMKEDLLHFVGSDCHDSRYRICRTGEAYKKVISKMGQEYADKIFIENPSAIVKNGENRRKLVKYT